MDLHKFAERWIEDWNSHDVERIVDHYADNAEFRSPVAEQRLGHGIVRGKSALRAYWQPAFELRPNLHFTLIKVFAGYRTLAIHYRDELSREVVETMVFDESGEVVFGSGCYA